MKKILITGNSGYIGSHLTKLLSSDYEVYGLDLQEPQSPVLQHYLCDIRRQFELQEEFDACIHLAALVNVGRSEKEPINYYITNLNGTMNVLSKIKCNNFIFASTGAAAGCASSYGISKRAAEDVVREYCTIHEPKHYTIFRFYNVIGYDGFSPTNPDGLMLNMINAVNTGKLIIHGNDYIESKDGTCVRDYTHVNEICNAIKVSIENPANKVECLGHGKGYTVNEIVEIFKVANDVDFTVEYGPRRKGDLPISVLEEVSPYMKSLYTIQELLKVS
jgi:UDP-glucose 4-epimerase